MGVIKREIESFRSRIPPIFSELEMSFESHGFMAKASGLGLYELLLGIKNKPDYGNIFLEVKCSDPGIYKEIIESYGDIGSIKTRTITSDIILVMFVEEKSSRIVLLRANRNEKVLGGEIKAENVYISPTTGEIFSDSESMKSFNKSEIDVDTEVRILSNQLGLSGFAFATELGFHPTPVFYDVVNNNKDDILKKYDRKQLAIMAKTSNYPSIGFGYLELFGICR